MKNERRLIDANRLIQDINADPYRTESEKSYVRCLVSRQPTIDAVEVVHGRWITHNKGQNNWCECSECNTVGSPFWKRCPMCEAKMDGDENGKN